MAVKSRFHPGTVDAGDLKAITEEVLDEAVELYDMAYRSVIETFGEPLSAREAQELVGAMDFPTVAAIVQGDPEAARELLRGG